MGEGALASPLSLAPWPLGLTTDFLTPALSSPCTITGSPLRALADRTHLSLSQTTPAQTLGQESPPPPHSSSYSECLEKAGAGESGSHGYQAPGSLLPFQEVFYGLTPTHLESQGIAM